MNHENIDFSIGLSASLKLLEMYRKNGILHAKIERVPGIREPCTAHIHLLNGRATICYLEGSSDQRYAVSETTLSRLDTERGPFAWSLQSPPISSPSSAPQEEEKPSLPTSLIPRRVAPLDMSQLHTWSAKERILLKAVFTFIDGHHSVEEIKERLTLSPDTVERVLQTLLSLGVITLTK